MILGDLLTRASDIIAADYERSAMVAYVNRGITVWRQQVEDRWFRAYIPLVAGQGVYSFPDENVRAQRIAYDDSTIEPTSILEMQALDSKWQTTTGAQPFKWTSDGLPHNQFRIYPVPSSSSTTEYAYEVAAAGGGTTADDGEIVWYEADTSTFETDPNDAGHTDPNAGLIVALDGAQFLENDGEVVVFEASGLELLEVWGVERTDPVSGDGDTILVKPGYELAPLWYALWQTYLEEGDRHDSGLAGLYRGLWADLVERALLRKANPLPLQVHVLGGGPGSRAQAFQDFSTSMTVGGVPINVRWPRLGGAVLGG